MLSTRDLTKMALLLALICISAYISIPLPFTMVMFTALTFVLCLTAILLTPKQVFIVTCVYVLLGLVLPVYANGGTGPSVLFGPLGGYIFSWPVSYTVFALIRGSNKEFTKNAWRAIVTTLPITYIMGMAGLVIVTHMPVSKAFMVGVLPFIITDIIKAVLACAVATRLNFK